MAALAKNTPRAHRSSGVDVQKSYVVANGDVIYMGAFVGIYKTGAKTGYLGPWSVVTGNSMQFLGMACKSVTGDGTKLCPVNCGGIELINVSVIGASAITQVQNSPVYLANDNDLTLSAPAAGGVVGHIVKWYNTTYCDVRMYSAEAYEAASST
jgi:hypothetical protein